MTQAEANKYARRLTEANVLGAARVAATQSPMLHHNAGPYLIEGRWMSGNMAMIATVARCEDLLTAMAENGSPRFAAVLRG